MEKILGFTLILSMIGFVFCLCAMPFSLRKTYSTFHKWAAIFSGIGLICMLIIIIFYS